MFSSSRIEMMVRRAGYGILSIRHQDYILNDSKHFH